MAHDTLVHGVLGEFELTTCNFIANVIDDCHGMTLYLNLTSPTHYFRAALHCETPNAGRQARPEAGAQRTLQGVAWTPWLGWERPVGCG